MKQPELATHFLHFQQWRLLICSSLLCLVVDSSLLFICVRAPPGSQHPGRRGLRRREATGDKPSGQRWSCSASPTPWPGIRRPAAACSPARLLPRAGAWAAPSLTPRRPAGRAGPARSALRGRGKVSPLRSAPYPSNRSLCRLPRRRPASLECRL